MLVWEPEQVVLAESVVSGKLEVRKAGVDSNLSSLARLVEASIALEDSLVRCRVRRVDRVRINNMLPIKVRLGTSIWDMPNTSKAPRTVDRRSTGTSPGRDIGSK